MALPEFQPGWAGLAREVLERSIERHGGWIVKHLGLATAGGRLAAALSKR